MAGEWEMLGRIAFGTLLGGIIGYERDRHGRPAGLRTHMIVALASATFMVISTQFVFFQGYTKEDLVSIDPSRIASSIVTGIGFLAGGAILRHGVTVEGLTTAAGLWLVAAIGMGAGAGMYVTSAFVTVLGIGSLTVVRRLEGKRDGFSRRAVELDLNDDASIGALTKRLELLGITVSALEYERHFDDRRVTVTLDLHFPAALGIEKVISEIEGQPGVRRLRMPQAA